MGLTPQVGAREVCLDLEEGERMVHGFDGWR
jgi:hypothetical protein